VLFGVCYALNRLDEEFAMRLRPRRHATGFAAALAVAAAMSGCTSLKSLWPWHHNAPPPPPPPAHALDISGAAASFPQYWQRNTLVVDLSAASGSGSITLKPVEGVSWPLRVALRVTPGSIGALEVRAAQRTVLPISTAGAKPVDLELTPGLYTPATPEMTVTWGPSTTALP
jgi:hypothetical protein